jgi:uncharacterized LabA/DUF88 family protein
LIIKKYCESFLDGSDSCLDIFYFTAIANWLPDSAKRHKIFINALENINVKVIFGNFKKVTRYCSICEKYYSGHEEKRTDVSIALYAYRLASKDNVDKITIISGDSDLVPAIELIKEDFPLKKVHISFPYNRESKQLSKIADSYNNIIDPSVLYKFQLPDKITLPSGKILKRPGAWS